MSFYKEQKKAKQKIKNTLIEQTRRNGGVSQAQLLVGVGVECEVSDKACIRFIENCKEAGLVEEREGMLRWMGKI